MRDGYSHPELEWARGSRLILITAHRRENLGEPTHRMFRAIRRVMEEHPDTKAIYPIHMNPLVRKAAHAELDGFDRLHIIVKQKHAFAWAARCFLRGVLSRVQILARSRRSELDLIWSSSLAAMRALSTVSD